MIPAALGIAVLALWVFPEIWFRGAGKPVKWLVEKQDLPNYSFHEVPVSESAERILVADKTINGEFTSADQREVRVFFAKRFVEKENEIGLFVHTPDRCWTEAGWKIEPVMPQLARVRVRGVEIPFERRIFDAGERRELVYFAGLIGGEPLPYRLDQNLSVAMRYQSSEKIDRSGAGLRLTDAHFWRRLWDVFASREELFGPMQFIRVSTSLEDQPVEAADQYLKKFLTEWLVKGDYREELRAWKTAGQENRVKG
jgi:hypothetical protein